MYPTYYMLITERHHLATAKSYEIIIDSVRKHKQRHYLYPESDLALTSVKSSGAGLCSSMDVDGGRWGDDGGHGVTGRLRLRDDFSDKSIGSCCCSPGGGRSGDGNSTGGKEIAGTCTNEDALMRPFVITNGESDSLMVRVVSVFGLIIINDLSVFDSTLELSIEPSRLLRSSGSADDAPESLGVLAEPRGSCFTLYMLLRKCAGRKLLGSMAEFELVLLFGEPPFCCCCSCSRQCILNQLERRP